MVHPSTEHNIITIWCICVPPVNDFSCFCFSETESVVRFLEIEQISEVLKQLSPIPTYKTTNITTMAPIRNHTNHTKIESPTKKYLLATIVIILVFINEVKKFHWWHQEDAK